MSNYITIVDALKDKVEAVSTTRNVYTFWRNVRFIKDRYERFVDTGGRRIHTWMITRSEAPQISDSASGAVRQHTFDIHGYYQVEDANESEETFQDIADDVIQYINTNQTFIDTTAMLSGVPQLITFEATPFCGVLCHHAHVQVIVEEDVDP